MMRKQEIPWLEENSVTHINNDCTPQKSTTTKSGSMSYDNKNEKVFSSRDTNNLCEISVHDISLNDSMVLNSNDTIDSHFKRNDSSHLPNINKESLYIKFDPLDAKSNANVPQENMKFIHSTEFDVGYETGSTESTTDQSLNTINSSGTTLNIFKEKPTQIVSPVTNENTVTGTHNHTPVLVRSASAFIALREVPIANLINIERNNPAQRTWSSLEHGHSDYNMYSIDVSELQTTKNILQKQECELHQLRKENRYLKAILHNLEKKKRITYEELALNLRAVSDENKTLLERQNQLLQKVKEKTYNNEQLCLVMEQYENTISALINKQQSLISEMYEKEAKLQSDKNQALNHLVNMETSFDDLLAKYNESKNTIKELQQKEKSYQDKTSKYELVIKQYQNMYLNLKQITYDALNSANDTWNHRVNDHLIEITKLKATIKKHDVTIASLQESILQKTHDNEELTAICDDLINKIH